jgi:RES domain-containing protein
VEVFRISKQAFAGSLSSSGIANRWNERGQQVIYTGSSRSLSSLELIVHKGAIVPYERYSVMVISITDNDDLYKQIQLRDLPTHWRSFDAYATLQKIGSKWFADQETLVLKVPSAVIPFEYNYVINTIHPEFARNVNLVRTEPYFWDSRLL